MVNFNLFNSELVVSLTAARELASYNSQANLKFVEISSSHLNEDILGVNRNLCGIRVDDWWEGKHLSVGVVEDWVFWLILNDVQVFLEFLILLEDFEKLLAVHIISLL